MTRRDPPGPRQTDAALGETIASSDGLGTSATVTPSEALGTSATVTPAEALGTSETVTPAEAVGLSETITPADALATRETVTPEALAIGATVTPAAAAAAMISIERRAASQLPEIARATYAVRRELARGGMGRILVADDSRLGRRVAIKELIANDRGLQRRFAREVRITARLQHPGIVPVYEAGHWPGGEPFYAMKLVAGTSLEKVVEARPELPDRLRLIPNLVQLTEAIAYAHGNGVIHRDLKPANVLVGDYGETVVIDWGLAKEISEGDDSLDDAVAPAAAGGMTIHGAVVGTPAYMPPEQARGERVGARADVYSLGALMWHVLAGRPPYLGTVEVVLESVRSEPPPRLVDVAPGVPEELATIVEHAMERDPDLRYPTARELAEELSRFQTGQLVTRHQYTTWQLLKRFVKRNRAAVMSGVALLVGASVVGAIAMRQVMAERDRARAVSLAALEEQGRRELVEGHPLRASVFFSEAYRGGRRDEALRLMLGEAMRSVDASIASWTAGVRVPHLAWSSRDQLVVIADDGAITLWDITSSTRSPIAGEAVRPQQIAMADNNTRLAVLGRSSLRIVDLDKRTSTIVKFGIDTPQHIAFVPGGGAIAIETYRGVRIFGVDGKERELAPGSTPKVTFPQPHEYIGGTVRVSSAPASDDPNTAPEDATPSDWFEVSEGGGYSWALARRDDPNAEDVAAIDHAGRRFAVGTQAGQIRLYDIDTGLPFVAIDAHSRAVRALAFDPVGSRFASAGDDGVIRVWEFPAGPAAPTEMVLSGPSDITASSADSRVRAKAKLNEVIVNGRTLQGSEELISWVDVSDDGAFVVAGARDGRVLRWDAATGRPLGTLQLSSPVTAGDIAHDGAFAIGTRDGSVRIVRDAATKPVALADHATAVHALAWHPHRPELLTAGDTAVRVWTVDGTLVRFLAAGEPVGRAWWAADGQWIIVDGEASVQVWDGEHGTLLLRFPHAATPLQQPQSEVNGAREGDNGAALARLGTTGFVPWLLPRETRPPATIASIVASRIPWRLAAGELVPAANLAALRSDENTHQMSTSLDFEGDTLEASPSKPAIPLAMTAPAVTKAFKALASGDRTTARTSLATVTDTQDSRTAYDVAWCWHFIGDEQAAYTMALRAYQMWHDAATKPHVLGDVLLFAAWAELPSDTVITALGTAADNKTRLALAERYDDLGRFALVTPTIESMKITDDWDTRARGLHLMASRAYMRGDLASAAEHLEVAARMLPPDKLPKVALGPKCGDVTSDPNLVASTDAADSIALLTQTLAARSFRTFNKVFDYRYAISSRRLFALLGDKFGVPHERIATCNTEIDAIAGASYARIGQLDNEMVREAFRRANSALMTCYQREVDTDASVEGRVVVRLELSATGQLSAIDTFPTPESPAMSSLASCVGVALSKPELPRQVSTTRMLINYPLRFQRADLPPLRSP